MNSGELQEVFAAEARDYIQALNEGLLALEEQPEDKDTLDSMFRSAHSLKGMAATMGFSALAAFTHRMENVFDKLRTNMLVVDEVVMDALFQAVDSLEYVLDQTLAGVPVESLNGVEEQLDSLLNRQTDKPAAAALSASELEESSSLLAGLDWPTVYEAQAQGYLAYQVRITLRENTLLKSVRVYTVFQVLENLGTVLQTEPSVQDLEEEQFDLDFQVVLLTLEDQAIVEKQILAVSEIAQVDIVVLEPDMPVSENAGAAEEVAPAAENPNEAGLSQEDATKTIKPANSSTARSQNRYVRVETERLDLLMNLIGELVTNRTQMIEQTRHIEEDTIDETVVQLDRITTDLQHASMELRMVPIKQVFDRFPRMVRDLARTHNKRVKLEVLGEETELDRTIVNQISDPLVHILRNSIDHGIEDAQTRKQLGKPESGTIRLEARHQGSHILIEIADDGMGIVVDRVAKKAAEKGLITKERQESLTMAEAIALLFHPGFSTADTVTDTSGRGVGMDAVKAVVEGLSGTVELRSEPGKGSCVTIKLPLTLAIIRALLVNVNQQTYAIPIQAVKENLRVGPSQVRSVQQRQMIYLRNEVVPLMDLGEVLGGPSTQPDPEAMPVIVVDTRDGKTAFVVDGLIGQQEIVIKRLSEICGDIPGIAGATVLGDGKVALILDNSTLLD